MPKIRGRVNAKTHEGLLIWIFTFCYLFYKSNYYKVFHIDYEPVMYTILFNEN